MKRGFEGGWRILDLLFGSHPSFARYTMVYESLSISLYPVDSERNTASGRREKKSRGNIQAKARSYSNIHLSIASSTNTKSTSVRVWAICLNFGLNPFKAAKILRRLSGEILLPLGLGVCAILSAFADQKMEGYSQTIRPFLPPLIGLLGALPLTLSCLGAALPLSIHLFIRS